MKYSVLRHFGGWGLALVGAAVCASCGGNGQSSTIPIGTNPDLTFRDASGYNGDSTGLSASKADLLIGATGTQWSLTAGGRTIRLELPTNKITPGTTIPITGSSLANAVYFEAKTVGSNSWIATSGTVAITAGPNGTVEAYFDLPFQADTTTVGNGATGTFSLQGHVKAIPDPYRSGTTQVSVTFTPGASYSGSSAAMPTSAVIGGVNTDEDGLRVAASVNTPVFRALEAQVAKHAPGAKSSMMPGSLHEFVTYTEGTSVWRSTSGTVTVGYVKLAGGRLALANVVMQPDESVLDNTAQGTFTLTGVLEKG